MRDWKLLAFVEIRCNTDLPTAQFDEQRQRVADLGAQYHDEVRAWSLGIYDLDEATFAKINKLHQLGREYKTVVTWRVPGAHTPAPSQ